MRLATLLQIPDDVYPEVGKYLLLFSHIEWLIANAILFSKITSTEYKKLDKMPITQEYFEVLLGLNYSKKLDALSKSGFDSTRLRETSLYRNTLSHGIIFKDEDNFTAKKATKIKNVGVSLHKDEVTRHINILMEEGGRLLDFIESMGYKYHEPS